MCKLSMILNPHSNIIPVSLLAFPRDVAAKYEGVAMYYNGGWYFRGS